LSSRRERGYIEFVSADAQQCPPDIEEVAEAYCMETLDPAARLAFEEHYLTCDSCASLVASTDEYIRAMRNALERLRSDEKDSLLTRRTGTR
jgi:anti-sigma factor RsiW